MNFRHNAALGAVSFAILTLCLLTTGCKTPSFKSAITQEQENTIGDWAAAQIQSESGAPPDPAISAQVTSIAKNMNAVLPALPPPHILVSDSDTYTVASLPGDWIVISAKTVVLLHDRPDALAGLIAHEYAHVEADDALKQMSNTLGSDTLVNLTAQGKYTDTSNIAVQLMNFSHNIDEEYRADAEGVRIAALAGYDPHGIVDAIAVLRAVTPTSDAQWLLVHPVTPKRLKLLNVYAAAYTKHSKN